MIPEEEVYQRLANRIMCKSCGANFNVLLNWEIDKCLECGWKTYRRNDDVDKNAIKNRINVYHNDIVPALKMLEEKWFLVKIDGMQSIEKIFEDILEVIKR